jgi:hypothetical protein
LHAGQVNWNLRDAYTRLCSLPPVVLLNHGEDSPRGRSAFDDHLRRVVGTQNKILLGDYTLSRLSPNWAPWRRAAVLTVDLPSRVRLAAESTRRSTNRPERFLRLLRELAIDEMATADDLWRYAADLAGTDLGAQRLLAVLPALASLDNGGFDALREAVDVVQYSDKDAACPLLSLADVVGTVTGLIKDRRTEFGMHDKETPSVFANLKLLPRPRPSGGKSWSRSSQTTCSPYVRVRLHRVDGI